MRLQEQLVLLILVLITIRTRIQDLHPLILDPLTRDLHLHFQDLQEVVVLVLQEVEAEVVVYVQVAAVVVDKAG